jgi:hypothetical protein
MVLYFHSLASGLDLRVSLPRCIGVDPVPTLRIIAFIELNIEYTMFG